MNPADHGSLYIVATPIGNLDDITRRAISVLSGVDGIAAEDTRRSGRLLQALGLHVPLFSLHDHNEGRKTPKVLRRLLQGESIALISDAGTPLLSDPGYALVRQAHQAGIKVIPVPGASSVPAALSCAGLPTDRFVFEGFLPSRQAARKKHLETLRDEERTLVFFEAPHRIAACLNDMETIFGGDRQAVMARELTKTHETILTGTLGELQDLAAKDPNQQRGEIVVLVEGRGKGEEPVSPEALALFEALREELPLKTAASLASRITGLPKNLFYKAGLVKKQLD